MTGTPALSVVIAVVSDTTEPRVDIGHLTGCLTALAEQVGAPHFEAIVGHLPDLEGVDALRARFPFASFVSVADVKGPRETGGGREHHDVLRARAMAKASADIVAMLEDHARPDPHWCANIAKAHEEPYACVGGAMGNAIDKALNWAVYFCDYGKYQNPLPEGPSHFASDSNAAYKRAALEKAPETWREAYRETLVNAAILKLGEKIVLRRDIVVNQHRKGLKLGPALRERYIWGRSYSAALNKTQSVPKRLVLAAASPILPFLLTFRHLRTAATRGAYFGKFLGAMPLVFILSVSWSVGEALGYVAGHRRGNG